LEEKSCKEAINLLGETKHILLTNFSSMGNGTVYMNIILWNNVVWNFIWIYVVLFFSSLKKQNGIGLHLLHTLSRNWSTTMRRLGRKRMSSLGLVCVVYWEQLSSSILLLFLTSMLVVLCRFLYYLLSYLFSIKQHCRFFQRTSTVCC